MFFSSLFKRISEYFEHSFRFPDSVSEYLSYYWYFPNQALSDLTRLLDNRVNVDPIRSPHVTVSDYQDSSVFGKSLRATFKSRARTPPPKHLNIRIYGLTDDALRHCSEHEKADLVPLCKNGMVIYFLNLPGVGHAPPGKMIHPKKAVEQLLASIRKITKKEFLHHYLSLPENKHLSLEEKKAIFKEGESKHPDFYKAFYLAYASKVSLMGHSMGGMFSIKTGALAHKNHFPIHVIGDRTFKHFTQAMTFYIAHHAPYLGGIFLGLILGGLLSFMTLGSTLWATFISSPNIWFTLVNPGTMLHALHLAFPMFLYPLLMCWIIFTFFMPASLIYFLVYPLNNVLAHLSHWSYDAKKELQHIPADKTKIFYFKEDSIVEPSIALKKHPDQPKTPAPDKWFDKTISITEVEKNKCGRDTHRYAHRRSPLRIVAFRKIVRGFLGIKEQDLMYQKKSTDKAPTLTVP